MKEFPEEKRESLEIIRFFVKNYKTFLIAVLGAAALSVGVTLFIPREYYSYGIVFPTASNSLETTVDNPVFGYDVEADRLIQIMQSREMYDSIVRKFDLVKYYDLDTSEPEWNDRLKKKYYRDIRFQRNISMSVTVSAQTTDPMLSAGIVNSILDYINIIRNRVIKTNLIQARDAYRTELLQKQKTVDQLVDSIAIMRNHIRDPQLSILSNQPFNMTVIGNRVYTNSTSVEAAINRYYYEQTRLNEIGAKYEKALAASERPISEVYILDRARPSYKKVYPSFTMNMVTAGFAAFVLTWLILFMSRKIKAIKKDL